MTGGSHSGFPSSRCHLWVAIWTAPRTVIWPEWDKTYMRRSLVQSQVHSNWSSCSRFTCYASPLHASFTTAPMKQHLPCQTLWNMCFSRRWHKLSVPWGTDYSLKCPLNCLLQWNSIVLRGPAQMFTLPGSLPFILLVNIHRIHFCFFQADCLQLYFVAYLCICVTLLLIYIYYLL